MATLGNSANLHKSKMATDHILTNILEPLDVELCIIPILGVFWCVESISDVTFSFQYQTCSFYCCYVCVDCPCSRPRRQCRHPPVRLSDVDDVGRPVDDGRAGPLSLLTKHRCLHLLLWHRWRQVATIAINCSGLTCFPHSAMFC